MYVHTVLLIMFTIFIVCVYYSILLAYIYFVLLPLLFLGYYHSFYGVVRNIYTHTIFIYLRGYTPYYAYYILGSLKKCHILILYKLYTHTLFLFEKIYSILYILNIRFLKKTYYILIFYKLLHTLILFERIYSILCMPFIGMSLLCMLDVHE